MQRVGASYVGKKIYDYLTAPPEQTAEPDPNQPDETSEASAEHDELDGQPFLDEEGERLGTAHRLPDVAVYVVSHGYGRPAVDFERLLADPDTRLFWRTADGRVSALIYVPDPSGAPVSPGAMRADEI